MKHVQRYQNIIMYCMHINDPNKVPERISYITYGFDIRYDLCISPMLSEKIWHSLHRSFLSHYRLHLIHCEKLLDSTSIILAQLAQSRRACFDCTTTTRVRLGYFMWGDSSVQSTYDWGLLSFIEHECIEDLKWGRMMITSKGYDLLYFIY